MRASESPTFFRRCRARPSKKRVSPSFRIKVSFSIWYSMLPFIMYLHSKASVRIICLRTAFFFSSSSTTSVAWEETLRVRIRRYEKPRTGSLENSFSWPFLIIRTCVLLKLSCISPKKLRRFSSSEWMILKRKGREGTVRLFSIWEMSPLLTPAFRASCSRVIFFCVRFVLILSPRSNRSSSFIMVVIVNGCDRLLRREDTENTQRSFFHGRKGKRSVPG